MAEMIIGAGYQKNIFHLLALLETEIRKSWGVPRRITAKSETVEIVADRPDFKSEFQSFVIRLKTEGDVLEAVKKIASDHDRICTLDTEGEWRVLTCPSDGQEWTKEGEKAVKAVSSAMTLPEIWRVEGGRYRTERLSVELIFKAMVEYKASDVHLSPGSHPIFRVDNKTQFSEIMEPPSANQILTLIEDMAPPEEWQAYQDVKQTSFSFHQVGLGYARVSAFWKQGAPHLTFRYLPEQIPTFEELNVPADTMRELASLHRGLIMVTGMTGSGKTTSMAALVEWININRAAHILTIENPIEYVFTPKRAVISQRSLGRDIGTFGEAVHGAMRQDPDVIVIGEMRDSDTIRSAITAASTGHLVLGTLHSNSASEVVNRIISFFDPVERDLVKLQLRDSLKCVICQRLIPRKGGGRLPAMEILLNDIKPINDGIIEGDTDAIRIGMQQTTTHSFLFETYLHGLFKDGKIDLETAQANSTEQSMFDQLHMGTYSVPRLESLKKH